MTMQVKDNFFYRERFYYNPSRNQMLPTFFKPQDYGIIRSKDPDTCCWRGYIATLDVRDDGLFLVRLDVNVDGDPPPFNRVQPFIRDASNTKDGSFNTTYKDVNLRTNYTGSILLAEGKWNILMKRFREVYEFTFENGSLVNTFDCVAELTRLGRKPTPRGERGPPPGPDDPPWLDELSKKYYCLLISEIDPGG